MTPEGLAALAEGLAAHPSIRGKRDVAVAAAALGLDASAPGRPGDDAAALPRADGGWDLFAAEAFIPAFVADDPWFAGWCGVMVNLSDIAAMGGRATALTDMVWAPDAAAAAPLLGGLRAASAAYGVPIVGGHTNLKAPALSLAVAVTGRAERLISGHGARPGDALVAAVDLRGGWRPRFDNWFAGDAPPERLRGDLALLPALAEEGLVAAGKDVSQGGVVGTALMLAEGSGCGFEIEIEALPMPAGAETARWLRAFPSFGFLLSVDPGRAGTVIARFEDRGIAAAAVGRATEGSAVDLRAGGAVARFWDWRAAPYLALGPAPEAAHA